MGWAHALSYQYVRTSHWEIRACCIFGCWSVRCGLIMFAISEILYAGAVVGPQGLQRLHGDPIHRHGRGAETLGPHNRVRRSPY